MKTCIKCNKIKEQTDFHKDNSTKDGLSSYCKDCHKAYKANIRLSHKELGLCIHCSNPAVIGRVQCTKCIEVKKAYAQRNKEKFKEYYKEYYKEYRKEYKDRESTLSRLRLYNLTKERYNELLLQQEYKCAICKLPLIKPVVDHCHSTGKVRGILCNSCNTGLGMFKDSLRLTVAATKYLSSITEELIRGSTQ